jgi:spore germination protein YaaH
MARLFRGSRSTVTLMLMLVLWTAFPLTALAAKSEALFYYVSSDDGWASLSSNATKISLLAPQVFIVDESGKIHGQVEDRVRALAVQHGITLMPLLANEKPQAAHNVLVDPALRTQVIADSLRLCREVACVGLQIDLEGVLQEDGKSFTEFVREASQVFHGQHLQLSVALPTPLLTPSPKETYNDWFGGFVVYHEPYDMGQIAPLVDFISLMTYGQFGKGTPAGPVAGYAWVEQSIRYALQFVPKRKLSLGLGFWAYRWCGEQVTYSGYSDVNDILLRSGAASQWHAEYRSPWFQADVDGCPTSVWYENRRSLQEKLKLMRHYKLKGFSAWRLGQEDPSFWDEMREKRR